MATSMRIILFCRANLLSLLRSRSNSSKRVKTYSNINSNSNTGAKNAKTKNERPISKVVLSDLMSESVQEKGSDEGPVSKVVLSNIMTNGVLKEELDHHDVIAERLKTARRTVLIKTDNIDHSVKKLNQFGSPENILNIKKENGLYHMVTFKDETHIQNLASSLENSNVFVQRFIIDTKAKKKKEQNQKEDQELCLTKQLELCENIDEQLHCLYKHTHLDETNSLLIFLYYSIIQDVFRTLSNGVLEPFGSCVNGFGMNSSDLDLNYIDLKKDSFERDLCPMFSHKPESVSINRLKSIKTSLRKMLPIINDGTVIAARIPIIRLSLKPVNFQIDIAFPGDRQGPIISEIFYTYSLLDNRIAILFAFIKRWAITNGLHRSNAGHWFSSFQLLALVIFYFQQRPNSSIPSIKTLLECNQRYTSTDKQRVSTPLYVIKSLTKNPSFESSLETLLKEFFEFYAVFDFRSMALSLLMGHTFQKTTITSPIQCEFPFEFHNIMKNVDSKHTALLQTQSKKALILLNKSKSTNELWGIGSCLSKDEQDKVDMKISIKQLFID
ncbi:hypothetical protein LOTGIDRAFT_236893 [Lottia gigantea]|uniref:Poly(A) RNA polymerase mitochondrial-like central palm domain-containing protein n=1 Tax=Lottia gigantea TaxID=225164 RepID=V3ZQ11_LOTGI|nr:hypothetical protein LOTGIDRAFT_236893 [Lottia gigantea]ESO82956.1 hypothetical protein LOTGIDRAFT_236893 [Lottia gigantea]